MLDGWGGCPEPWDDVEGNYAPGAFGGMESNNNNNIDYCYNNECQERKYYRRKYKKYNTIQATDEESAF